MKRDHGDRAWYEDLWDRDDGLRVGDDGLIHGDDGPLHGESGLGEVDGDRSLFRETQAITEARYSTIPRRRRAAMFDNKGDRGLID